jgi:hypothetical protein
VKLVLKDDTKTNRSFEQGIVWFFHCVMDGLVSGQMENDGLGKSKILGETTGNKGTVDIFLYRLSIKDYLLGPLLDKISMPAEQKIIMREVFANHDSFRAKRGFDKDGELSWQSGWSSAATSHAAFVEALVYNNVHKAALLGAVRAGRSPEEMISMNEQLATIKESIFEQAAHSEAEDEADAEEAGAGARHDDETAEEDAELLHLKTLVQNFGLLDSEGQETVTKHRKGIVDRIKQNVRFVVEGRTAAALAEEINNFKPSCEAATDTDKCAISPASAHQVHCSREFSSCSKLSLPLFTAAT